MAERVRVVVIGGSVGSIEALRVLLPALPSPFPAPLAIVVHQPRDARALLVEAFADLVALSPKLAEPGERLAPGGAWFAPPDYHLLVDRAADEGVIAELSVEEPVWFARPSIDVLFESAADSFGPAAVGVLLSGANADGAQGLARIVARGGRALVQDPSTAPGPEMPGAALALGFEARVEPPDRLAAALGALVRSA